METNMDFQISALDAGQFRPLFEMDTEALAEQGILRSITDSTPGYPCRVSLQDAKVGEKVLLLNFEHQPARTPFRSSHAIYVREGATRARPAVNEVPEMFRHRLLSLRAFDAAGMIVNADVAEGGRLEGVLECMLSDPSVDKVHIHNAKLGCYLAAAERA